MIRLATKMQKFDNPEIIPDIIKHMYVVENFDKERI